MECPYSKQQSNHGIMVEEAEANLLDSISSSSSQGFSITSSESDFTEEFISSASSSSPEQQLANTDSLPDMSSLLQQLPKRGLSKHYHGKSESFTSLSNVRCIEDLAKPDKPYMKRLKLWKRFGGLSETHKPCPPNIFSKKASRGSRSSFAKSGSFLGNRLTPRKAISTSSAKAEILANFYFN